MQLQPQFTDYFNKLIATFESENPGLKVRWVDVPWTAMESKILTAVSAKTAPDVVNLNPALMTMKSPSKCDLMMLALEIAIPCRIRTILPRLLTRVT